MKLFLNKYILSKWSITSVSSEHFEKSIAIKYVILSYWESRLIAENVFISFLIQICSLAQEKNKCICLNFFLWKVKLNLTKVYLKKNYTFFFFRIRTNWWCFWRSYNYLYRKEEVWECGKNYIHEKLKAYSEISVKSNIFL